MWLFVGVWVEILNKKIQKYNKSKIPLKARALRYL